MFWEEYTSYSEIVYLIEKWYLFYLFLEIKWQFVDIGNKVIANMVTKQNGDDEQKAWMHNSYFQSIQTP